MTFLPTYILAHVIISQLTDSSAVTNHALQFSAKHVLQTAIKNRTWCGPSSAATAAARKKNNVMWQGKVLIIWNRKLHNKQHYN